ncbi:MAG: ATP-grasp domain-containing protein [Nanoarchaeota archaeon]|nr:ATP-grasp domain-containing protein [Nanoarchaeota archaeon]
MKKLKLINNPYLDEIGWDKYLTYKIFMKYMPDSFLVNNKQELEKAVEKIKTEKVVLKPRHGSRGWHIKVIDKKDLPDKIEKNTLAMEFIDTSKGIKSLGIKKRHDFRVLIVDGKIDHCYVRIPKKGSFLANCAKGASKIFIANDKIPKEVVKIVKKVDDRFKKYKPRVYTIDFLFDKGKKPYLIEFNSQPGAFYYDNHEEIRARYFENIFKAIKDYLKNK